MVDQHRPDTARKAAQILGAVALIVSPLISPGLSCLLGAEALGCSQRATFTASSVVHCVMKQSQHIKVLTHTLKSIRGLSPASARFWLRRPKTARKVGDLVHTTKFEQQGALHDAVVVRLEA
jgi:hypothetical protein